MLMNLVAQRHVGARTGARLSRFPADRAEKRLLPVIREVVLLAFTAACDCPRFDLRGLIPHLDRIAEQDGRLILGRAGRIDFGARFAIGHQAIEADTSGERSEEHTSELQSLMRISYAVFCLKKQKN